MYGCSLLTRVLFNAIALFFIATPSLLFPQKAFSDNFLDNVSVFEEDGVYHISITAEMDVSVKHIRQVLTDYIHIYRLSDSIIKSRILAPTADNKVQVETLVLCCIPLFCREVTRVEEVSILDSGDLYSRIIPERSDFSSGSAIWKVESISDKTRLSYQAHLEPKFFIPPIIGTRMVVDNLRKEFSTTFSRVQHIASINEEKEWNDSFVFVKVAQHSNEIPCNTASQESFP